MSADLLYFSHPPVQALKGPFVGDIVDEKDALSSSRVGPDDGAKPSLPRSVPQLQFNPLAVQENHCGLVT